MTNPPLQRFGSAVLLQGDALRAAFILAAIGLTKLERDGRRPSPSERELIAVMEAANSQGQHERRREVVVTPIPATCSIDTAEAAEILGCTRRNVQKIARSLDGQRSRPGNTWVFDRRIVVAYRNSEAAA